MDGRIKTTCHSDLPWRINEFAGDFTLIDAWALPARGTLEEFADLYQFMASLDPAGDSGSPATSALFAVRSKLGERMGWDKPEVVNTLPIPGCTESSLRDRLPVDLAKTSGSSSAGTKFRPVFRIEDEAALELSNSLLHAILHLGWVRQPDDTFAGQMGVYVKHRGRVGAPYMALIAPFRHYIVYPALLRRIDTAWSARSMSSSTQPSTTRPTGTSR